MELKRLAIYLAIGTWVLTAFNAFLLTTVSHPVVVAIIFVCTLFTGAIAIWHTRNAILE